MVVDEGKAEAIAQESINRRCSEVLASIDMGTVVLPPGFPNGIVGALKDAIALHITLAKITRSTRWN